MINLATCMNIEVKKGDVRRIPGYDGVFGELVLDDKNAPKGVSISDKKQMSLGDY